MNNTTKSRKFGVARNKCEISLKILIPHERTDSFSMLIEAGTLLRVLDKSNRSNQVTVQVIDYFKKDPVWENLYSCNNSDIKYVNENLWPFVIAIEDPRIRLEFVQSKKSGNGSAIACLKIGDIISVSGEAFEKSGTYDCIIRYIGLVPEIGPGYYFGLEILNLNNGESPQTRNSYLVEKYLPCEPRLSIIATANWIKPSLVDPPEKFSTLEFLCGTFGRTVDFFNRENTLRRSSSRRQSRSRRVEYRNSVPSISSFASQLVPDSRLSNNGSSFRSVKMDSKPNNRQSFGPTNSSVRSSNERNKAAITNASNLIQSSDCGSSVENVSQSEKPDKTNTSENLILLDNEDYARFVENYERSLERQLVSESTQSDQQIPVNVNIPPISILKTPKPLQSTGNSSPGGVKPNAIMSLEDRDIVVIDKADIKESTKNERNVIVVDKPRTQQKDVDLADLLGNNWPTTAGDAALVLNADSSKVGVSRLGHGSNSSNISASSYSSKAERNKSMNPISHLMSSKALHKPKNRESVKVQTDFTLPSDGTTTRSLENRIRSSDPIYDNTNLASGQIISLTPTEEEPLAPSPISEIPGSKLGVGSMVEVSTDVCEDLYGVVRWIGCPQGSKTVMVGVELEDELVDRPVTLTDGTNNGVRLFRCPKDRALFVTPSQCFQDRRFQDIEVPSTSQHIQGTPNRVNSKSDAKMFGHVDCPPVAGAIAPLKILNLDELESICGKFKGIQGHHNSCYLDATLFAMFTFTAVFDSLLFRPPEPEDISHYEEVQRVLREEIVNPLRKNVFVRADRVMKLRQLLEKLSSVSGLTDQEKDPEEFLNSLLAQILRADPFLKLSSGQDTFFYQLFVEKDERLKNFPTVQQLFEQSFLASDIKLKEVPSCLIIQMPRFGKNFKMYPRILPSQVLDVTDIIEDSPRQCSVCGKLAEFECRECFGILQCGVGLESTAFCKNCLETVHSHAKRANHTAKKLSVPQDFKIMAEHLTVPRLFMELFAVVCIETSHYVAFVKTGSGPDAPWSFFDSMADRKGEQNGYNIPEMTSVPDLPQWLSDEGARSINEAASNDKMLPEHAKRLLCDAYMCMYQSTDVMMYR